MHIIADHGCMTRYRYATEEVFINTDMDEDNIFLAILHEIGHHVTTSFEDNCLTREVTAWDWVKENMGDYPIHKYEMIRNSRIQRRLNIIEEGSWHMS